MQPFSLLAGVAMCGCGVRDADDGTTEMVPNLAKGSTWIVVGLIVYIVILFHYYYKSTWPVLLQRVLYCYVDFLASILSVLDPIQWISFSILSSFSSEMSTDSP